MIDSSEFRRVMGHFPSGVAIVTTVRDDGAPAGLTASSVCSLSLDPTLVLVCVEKASDTHDVLKRRGVFAVNVLHGEHGETLARRFSTCEVDDKFRGIAFRPEHTGAPVLDEALAWVDCRVTDACRGGDHTVFIGEVVAGDAREGTPLVYYRGGYGRFAP